MARKVEVKVRGVYEKEPGSNCWWICYKKDGVRHREKVGRKSDAIKLYGDRKAEQRKGVKMPANMRSKGITFSALSLDALAYSKAHKKDQRNDISRMKALVSTFGDRVADDIKPDDIDNWLSAHNEWENSTRNRYRALMSLVYRQGIRNGKSATNPARLVRQRTEDNSRIRRLLDEEEVKLREVIRRRFPDREPLLDLALNMGMRLSNQFGLVWTRIHPDRNQLDLPGASTKNRATSYLPINSVALAAFRKLKKLYGDGKYVCFSDRKGVKTLTHPREWFVPAVKEAGIEDFHWHDCRHTFISRLVMAGVDLGAVQKLACHKTIAMTMHYAHLAPEHGQAAVERLVTVSK